MKTSLTPYRLIAQWLLGAVIGTLIIAVTSPLFVRSYLPKIFDPARGRVVPISGDYRWRSEGYATTKIGPHGMPGRTDLFNDESLPRIALWGDSQAEGVCVADDDKLFAQLQRSIGQTCGVHVVPLANSGDDAADWARQMELVEKSLEIEAHVILLADLPDLLPLNAMDFVYSSDPNPEKSQQSTLATYAPAFAIQAARHLVTDVHGNRRHIRFSVGPVAEGNSAVETTGTIDDAAWQSAIVRLKASSSKPIVLIYAPSLPSITNGKIATENPWTSAWEAIQTNCRLHNILTIDTSDVLRKSSLSGQWTHGFHNGRFGSGHLNRTGYHVIADQAGPMISTLLRSRD